MTSLISDIEDTTAVFATKSRKSRPVHVAIIGRPNVGKSTLINRLIGARRAIVDDVPGVTRDRNFFEAEWQGRDFTLIDTGGLVPGSDEHWETRINTQVDIALEEADAVLFLVDAQVGVTEDDRLIARKLQQGNLPVLVVGNKADNEIFKSQALEFYALGLGDPHPISAMHGAGTGDLLDALVATFPPVTQGREAETDDGTIRLAIVGKPNVGKSSILNHLIGQTRAIVSNESGTTRDPIDVELTHGDHQFVVVDTAGIRRKSKVDYGIERFAVERALRTMREADVTLMVVDVTEGITDQDKRLIELSNEAGNALVVVFNKWDLIPDKGSNTQARLEKLWRLDLPHASWAEFITTSAPEGERGQRLPKLLEAAVRANENNKRRHRTSVVNQVLQEAISMSPPPTRKNRALNMLYATQVAVGPPTFVLFVNHPTLLTDTYKRYLEHSLRKHFELGGTPVVLLARERAESKSSGRSSKRH